MSIIVTDTGFASDDWQEVFLTLDQLDALAPASAPAIDLAPDTDVSALEGRLDGIGMIRIGFANFADGRGFTLARMLRRMGFAGRLRAQGHILADQYAMARRSGFDEVEIDDALALRQPESQWLSRANWRLHDYQKRLRA